jgi:hypothetical protein
MFVPIFWRDDDAYLPYYVVAYVPGDDNVHSSCCENLHLRMYEPVNGFPQHAVLSSNTKYHLHYFRELFYNCKVYCQCLQILF